MKKQDFKLPSSEDAEQAVLGALILDKDAIYSVISLIRAEHFYNPHHKSTYKAILSLFEAGTPIDMLTVTQELLKSLKLAKMGGPYFLVELTNRVASSANIQSHCKIIVQNWMRREAVKAAATMRSDALDMSLDEFEIVDKAELRLEEIKGVAGTTTKTNSEELLELDKKIDRNIARGAMGAPIFGIDKLDNFIQGADEEDFIVLAGDSSMGKSSLVNSAVRHCVINKIPALFWSMEMSNTNTICRAIAAITNIPFKRIMMGEVYRDEEPKYRAARQLIAEAPVFFEERAGINILDFRARLTALKKKHNIKVAFLDRLGLLDDLTGTEKLNTSERIGKNTQVLRAACMGLGLPIVALNQLTKEVRKAPLCIPNRSFLYGSSKIANDATKIIFVYRPEFYGIEFDENNESTAGAAYFITDKNTNGPTGTVKAAFNAECMYFCNEVDLDSAEAGKDDNSIINSLKQVDKTPF